MSLHDAIAAALPGLRAEAESLMVDTVVVEVESGATLDPVTLAEVPTFEPVYEGPGRVQRTNAQQASDLVVGGVEFSGVPFLAQLPVTAAGIPVGARVRVTAVGAVSDPDLVGLVGPVRANLAKTHATKRTLVCEEVSS